MSILVVIIITLVIIVFGVIVYFFLRQRPTAQSSSQTISSTQQPGTIGSGSSIQCLLYNPLLGNDFNLQKFIPTTSSWTTSSISQYGCILNTNNVAWMDITGIAGHTSRDSSDFACCLNGATAYQICGANCVNACAFDFETLQKMANEGTVLKSAIYPNVTYDMGVPASMWSSTSGIGIVGPYAGVLYESGSSNKTFISANPSTVLPAEQACFLYNTISANCGDSIGDITFGGSMWKLSQTQMPANCPVSPPQYPSSTCSAPLVDIVAPPVNTHNPQYLTGRLAEQTNDVPNVFVDTVPTAVILSETVSGLGNFLLTTETCPPGALVINGKTIGKGETRTQDGQIINHCGYYKFPPANASPAYLPDVPGFSGCPAGTETKYNWLNSKIKFDGCSTNVRLCR